MAKLLSVAILGHVLRSVVKSEVEDDMEAEFLMISNGVSSLYRNEELAWYFMTRSNDIDKWGRQHMRSSKSYLAG
jgi:hypothetical protein